MRKNFIPRNDGFDCEVCDEEVPPAPGTFRNHCPACLTSKHVDQEIPGDRASDCYGVMPTIRYVGTDPEKLDLIQKCTICYKESVNRTAPDDNVSQLFDEGFLENNI
jgi:hypothetical protein